MSDPKLPPDTEADDMKVLSLEEYKLKRQQDHMVVKCTVQEKKATDDEEAKLSLEEIKKKNEENEERIKRERAKANKNIIKDLSKK